jgi:hypothetical protein
LAVGRRQKAFTAEHAEIAEKVIPETGDGRIFSALSAYSAVKGFPDG